MMMPANFSVMAENELVYVVGGSAVTDWAKTFNTNLVTMVGNSFVERLVKTTLGTMFGGMWGNNSGLIDNFSNEFFPDGQSGLNTVMSAVGVGAAVYQLGMVGTKSNVSDPANTWDGESYKDNGKKKTFKTFWFADGATNKKVWNKYGTATKKFA